MELKEYFDELANLILKYPQISKNSKFVLVPGPDDPGSANVLPRHGVSRIGHIKTNLLTFTYSSFLIYAPMTLFEESQM